MPIDLRELILHIKENKDFKSHLCLDIGCSIESDDSKPLIKVINYIINYLKDAGTGEIQIDLDSHHSKHQLVFIVHTENTNIPLQNDQLHSILKSYGAEAEWIFEPAKYVKCVLTFGSLRSQ
ncbi:hypothetical protein JNM05_04440 [bacterium]|nr:hypothetical protein [bacterium]